MLKPPSPPRLARRSPPPRRTPSDRPKVSRLDDARLYHHLAHRHIQRQQQLAHVLQLGGVSVTNSWLVRGSANGAAAFGQESRVLTAAAAAAPPEELVGGQLHHHVGGLGVVQLVGLGAQGSSLAMAWAASKSLRVRSSISSLGAIHSTVPDLRMPRPLASMMICKA